VKLVLARHDQWPVFIEGAGVDETRYILARHLVTCPARREGRRVDRDARADPVLPRSAAAALAKQDQRQLKAMREFEDTVLLVVVPVTLRSRQHGVVVMDQRVVDILVKDEFAAVDAVKTYLSYFQGPIATWEAHDQRKLRHAVPENRLRLYNMRDIVHTIADQGSVMEIREKFGVGIITAFIRVEGRPMGVVANNPHHLSGAIDAHGSDKGARFMQLCDAFDIPVLNLIDCPGIMVGPDAERTALVRHCTRLFNIGANMTAPLFTVVVRKAYGLGAQAMLGAGALVGFFSVAWPTAEFAGMNIEGAVKLGYRRELMAIEEPEQRLAEFQRRTAIAYDNARAVNAVMGGGIDDVIDPADTRRWIANGLKRLPPVLPRTQKKYPYVDPW
jgi:acetyl-CoA carboxylase carboxyltransferase component